MYCWMLLGGATDAIRIKNWNCSARIKTRNEAANTHVEEDRFTVAG